MLLCGLDKKEAEKFISNLKGLNHALEEEDFKRIREEEMYQKAVDVIKELAGKMSGKCSLPPHGMIDPVDSAKAMDVCIRKEKTQCATNQITSMSLGLLQEALDELGPRSS